MYDVAVEADTDKILKKLARRNPKQIEIIDKKVLQIQKSPNASYKFLHGILRGFCSAHIDTQYVVIFKINHLTRKIELYHYAHHDFVYSWQPKEKERIRFV